jgi:Calpain family cysteine protease
VQKWVRASQTTDRKCVLFKGTGVSHEDVVQGQLGDCYFLSAISVLGQGNVQAMIRTREGNPMTRVYEWEKAGCFCVRFYRDGVEEYVVIDDIFPARTNPQTGKMEWAFVKGGP